MVEMNSMYNSLLQIPMFQGISTGDLTAILGKIEIYFRKVSKGEVFIKEGDDCNNIIFIIKGGVESFFKGKNYDFMFIEKYAANEIIEFYSLFGSSTKYTKSYMTAEDSFLVFIDKKYLLPQFRLYDIFNINVLNMLCSKIQSCRSKIMLGNAQTAEDKILQLFARLSDIKYGEKRMLVRMEDLAKIIGETRLTTSRALNSLKENNMILLKRKEIVLKEARNITGIMMENFTI